MELGLAETTFNPIPEDGVPPYDRVSRIPANLEENLEGAGRELLTKARETYDLVVPEGENIVRGVLGSGKRLDSKKRVFSAVPNTILVYGGVALILYLVLKK